MSWKQPISTEVLKCDAITRLVYCEIMLHTRNEDMQYPDTFFNGNKRYQVQLKKGQSIFVVDRFCNDTGMSKRHVKKSLEFLEKSNFLAKVQINRMSFGLIITVQNYDEVVSFANQTQIVSKSLVNQTQIVSKSNNKSDKNVKREESEKKQPAEFQKKELMAHQESELVTLTRELKPEMIDDPRFPLIIGEVRKKPQDKQLDFLRYVLENKEGDKAYKLGYYPTFYWNDFIEKHTEQEDTRLAEEAWKEWVALDNARDDEVMRINKENDQRLREGRELLDNPPFVESYENILRKKKGLPPLEKKEVVSLKEYDKYDAGYQFYG